MVRVGVSTNGKHPKNRRKTHETHTQTQYTTHGQIWQNGHECDRGTGMFMDDRGGYVWVWMGAGEHNCGLGHRKGAERVTGDHFQSWTHTPVQ